MPPAAGTGVVSAFRNETKWEDAEGLEDTIAWITRSLAFCKSLLFVLELNAGGFDLSG